MPEIGLDAAVEVPDDLPDERVEMYMQFGELFEELFETFIRKNLDYDSSFVTGGVKAALKGKYEDPVEANIDQIQVRLSDKDDRVDSLNFKGNEDRVGEKLSETAKDAAVYRVMQAWLAEYGDEMIPEMVDLGVDNNPFKGPHTLARNARAIGANEDMVQELVDSAFGKGTYEMNEVRAGA